MGCTYSKPYLVSCRPPNEYFIAWKLTEIRARVENSREDIACVETHRTHGRVRVLFRIRSFCCTFCRVQSGLVEIVVAKVCRWMCMSTEVKPCVVGLQLRRGF